MFAKGSIFGEAVAGEGGVDVSDQAIERTRDILMLRLRRRGLPLRAIARIMNVSHPTVIRRINSIPPKVRDRYGRCELG